MTAVERMKAALAHQGQRCVPRGQNDRDTNSVGGTITRGRSTEYGSNVDPTLWLEYFAQSLVKALSERKPELVRLRDTFARAYNMGAEKGLSRDQVEAIMFAAAYGSVTTGEYINATKLSRSTVVKRLNELVEKGIMQVSGKGRGVSYRLVSFPGLGSEEKSEGVQLSLKVADAKPNKEE